VVVITMKQGESPASAIVTMGPDGAPLAVQVPSTKSRDGWTIPRAATEADIAFAVQRADRLAQAMTQATTRTGMSGAMLPLLLVPVGFVAVGLRRTLRRDAE
jgi:hypothetical protein